MSLPGVVRAQFTYTEDFKNDTAPGWSFYQGSSGPGPRLTSGATGISGADPEGATTLDPSGSGWLRLATATTQQANAVFFDTPIPSAGNEVKISFNMNMWGGNNFNNTGADGLTFFLYDASVPFDVGAFGGSLGYAQKDAAQGADTTHDGLAGGFLGVAFDAYGNFSREAEGREGGTTSLSPNSVVLRGPGSGQDGYDYLAGTTGSNGTLGYDLTDTGGATTHDTGDNVLAAVPYTMAFKDAAARPDQSTQYRKVEFTLTEASQLIIRMQFGEDGLWYEVMNADVSEFARPEQLRFGFSAGTGSGTQVYEVGGLLQITATAGSGSFLWDRGDGTNVWGTDPTDPINWYGNTNPTSKSNVVFNSAYVGGAQTVDLQDGDKTVKNIYFSGANAYNLTTTDNRKLIFDSDTVGGLTTISLVNDVTGNAAHSVGVDVQLNKTLDINNTIATHDFTLSGNVDTNGNALNFKGNGTTVLSGVVSGTGNLVKSDSGTTVLSGAGANTYTGATTVNGGTLRLEKAAALGSTATGTTVNAGGTLALGGTGTSFAAESLTLNGSGAANGGALRNVAGNNTWTGTVALASDSNVGVDGSTTLTVSGVVSGPAGNDLTKVGTGTLVLSGTNTYSGSTNVNGGTLRISSDANLGTAPGAPTAGALTLNGGTLNTTASLTLSANRGVTLNTPGGGTFETNSGTTLSYTGVIAGSGDLHKSGTGTLALGGTNTYTGATNINAGTLTLTAGNVLADGTAVTVAGGATFNVNGQADTIASLAGSGNTTLGSGTLTIGSGDASGTYSGVASGTGGITKTGAGNLTLSGTNTYTGTTQVDAGTVTLGASNVLANASTLVLNGGTFAIGGNFSDTIGTLTLASSSSLDFNFISGALTFTNADRTGGVLTIYDWAGDMSGGGASQLLFANAPTGFSTATDIVFDGYAAGFTRLASGEIVPLTGTTYEWNVNAAGNWTTDANWTPDPTGAGVGPNGTGVTVIFGDVIGANRTVTVSGTKTVGYMVFNDDNLYTISGGTVSLNTSAGFAQINVSNTGGGTISSALTLNDDLKINQNSSGTFTIAGGISNASGTNDITVNGTGNTALAGAITTGTGSLTKNGTGVLTLAGTNTYSGGTTVNAGTVRISSDANLGATTGAVTLDGGTLEATNTLTLNAARSVSINANGGTIDVDATRTLTYNGVLTGSGELTKTDTGTFVLGGATTNTHTGNITISAGTLQIAKTGAANRGLGDDAAVSIASGAELSFNGGQSETVGSIAGAGVIDNDNGTAITLTTGQNNASTTFAGVIQDTGGNLSLTKTGGGTLTLTGTNTYAGATTVGTGVLNIQNSAGLGTATSGTTVSTGAALELQHTTGIAVGAEALSISGDGLSSGGALRNVAGTNSYAGNVTLTGTGAEIQSDAGTLTLSGTINGNAASRTLAFDGVGNITATGAIGANVSTVTKNGAGTLSLSGANSYTGTTTINAGTVVVSSATALGTTGAATTVVSGATLSLSSGATMTVAENLTLSGQGIGSNGALRSLAGTNTLSGTVALGSETYVGVSSGSQLTASGVISGAYGLTKVGDGTLVLSNATNTYTGTTAVNAGTLVAQSAGALGTNANPTTVATGATVALNGGFSTTESFTLAGAGVSAAGALQSTAGTNTVTGAINLVADATIGVSAGASLTAGGVVAGAGYGVTKAGTGTLTLTAANTYTGTTTINAGVVNIQHAAALGSVDAGTVVASGAALEMQGGLTIGAEGVSLAGTGVSADGALRNVSGSNSLAGSITLAAATEIQSDAGTLTLSGGISGSGHDLTIDGAGATTISGVIATGAGTLTKTGAGSLVLSGASTFTGATALTGGTTTLGATGGALGGTSGVSLGAGTTLVLGAGDQINDTASLTLSGGTLRLGGFQEVLGNIALTASTTSTVDYLNDNSLLRFTGSATVAVSSQLTVDNWAGNPLTGGSTNYGLLFNTQSEALALESSVLFNGWSTLGNNQVILNDNGFYEIVPIVTIKEWNIAGSGAWDTGTTWNPTGAPDSTAAIALLGDSITAGTTAILNTSTVGTDADTVSKLMIATTGDRNYTITGTGSEYLEFNTSAGTAQLIVSGDGSHTIQNHLRVSDDLVITNDGTDATALTISATMDLRNGANSDLTVTGSGRTAITGVISGNTAGASLLKTGDGTLSLEAANSYTGTTTVRNGTLEVNGDAPSGSAGRLGNATSAVVINDSGTAAGNNTALLMTDLDGGSTIARNISVGSQGATTTLGGTNTAGTNTFSGSVSLAKDVVLSAASGGTVSFTGALTGAGGIEKTGAGTVVLGGATQNSFAGNVTVTAGTLSIAKTGAGVDALPASGNQGAIGDQAAVSIGSGASVVFNGDTNQTLEEIGSLAGSAGASVDVQQATALTLYTGQNNTSTTYAGTLNNSGGNLSLVKQGTGTMTLSGANTFEGSTAVDAGTLVIAHSSALGSATGGTSVAAGATLELQNNVSVAAGESLTLGTSASASTAVLRSSTGTNSIAGNVLLSGSATQGARLDVSTGSALELSGAITESAGSFVTKTGGGTLALSGSSASTFSGGLNVKDGTVTLNKSGAGANSATGTGTLSVGDGIGLADSAVVSLLAGNQIHDSAAVSLAWDGRLQLNGYVDTVGSIAGSGEIIMGTGQLIAGGNNTSTSFAGTLVGDSAAILTKGGTGTLTITSNLNAAPGDFAGAIDLSAGTLAFNVDNAFTGTLNVFAGTTLKLSDADLTVNNLNFTGSGTITLDFSGTSTLSVEHLTIAAGITVNVINWTNATDYFFAQNWAGAMPDLTAQSPMNQVIFASFTADDTKWQSYDKQVTPVPEPSTYGAALLTLVASLLGWRRRRKRVEFAAGEQKAAIDEHCA